MTDTADTKQGLIIIMSCYFFFLLSLAGWLLVVFPWQSQWDTWDSLRWPAVDAGHLLGAQWALSLAVPSPVAWPPFSRAAGFQEGVFQAVAFQESQGNFQGFIWPSSVSTQMLLLLCFTGQTSHEAQPVSTGRAVGFHLLVQGTAWMDREWRNCWQPSLGIMYHWGSQFQICIDIQVWK